ncbi:MAG: hypothetical protein ACJ8DX_12195 [Xanthobacteraceae bacterium]
MRSLIFRCPATGAAIDSGFETDTLSQLRLFTLSVPCAGCGETHRFTVSEADGAVQAVSPLDGLMAPVIGSPRIKSGGGRALA